MNISEQPHQFVEIDDISRGLIVDENNKEHNWNVFVCKDSNGKMSEVGTITGIAVDMVVIDHKCSVCGRLRSKLDKKELASINDALIKLSNKPTKKTTAKQNLSAFVKKKDADTKMLSTFVEGKQTTKWASDFSVIVKLAEHVQHPQIIIEAIGDIEGRDFSEIVAGNVAFGTIEDAYDPRIMNTLAEMLRFREKCKLAELPDLPEFNNEEFRTLEPKQMRSYIIQQMCKWAIGNSKNIRPAIKPIFDEIIQGQRKLSKPNAIEWKMGNTELDDIFTE